MKCPFSGDMHILQVWARIMYLWPMSDVQLKWKHTVTQLWESSYSSNNASIYQQRVCPGMVHCWVCHNTNVQLFTSSRFNFWPFFIMDIAIGTYNNMNFITMESITSKLLINTFLFYDKISCNLYSTGRCKVIKNMNPKWLSFTSDPMS